MNKKKLFKKLDSQLIENHICPKHKAKIANGMFVAFNHRALAPINEQGKRMLLKIGGYLNIHLNLHTNELFTIFENRKLLLVDVNPNLLFEDQCENLMITKRKFELEKQRQANKTKFINQNLERKKASIGYQIKHLKKLIEEAQNNGIFIKTDY